VIGGMFDVGQPHISKIINNLKRIKTITSAETKKKKDRFYRGKMDGNIRIK
jgi:hypothetical protein